MSWGRDIRAKELTLVPDGAGGLEPRLLPPTRQAIRAAVAARIDAYTPEWTNRRAGDAGVALVHAYGTVAEAVDVRLNRMPRRLEQELLDLAGVRALRPRPALAVLALTVSPRATAPLDVPAGTGLLVPGGDPPVIVETEQRCEALPGALATVAVLAEGWTVSDKPGELAGLAPFGPRPHVPAELWLGIDAPVAPRALLSLAIELVTPQERATASAVATADAPSPPLLRWEAVTSGGGVELPVERDGTAGLSRSGVIALRVDIAAWTPRALPGRSGDKPLLWLRARLVTNDYPGDRRLARVTLNGVPGIAARSVRDEVLEPLERPVNGRSRYRLAQVPVVPGSVVIDVADASSDPFGLEDPGLTAWEEADDLAILGPDDRRFTLDAAAGVVTFGDGVHGRAVPDGYRNVVAREYRAAPPPRGGTAGLPAPGDTIPSQLSIPDLAGATVLTITTGADAEGVTDLARRGPARICSRGRAVAPADYAELALGADGVDIARAHCLPATDPAAPRGVVAGVVGVIVVPRTLASGPPVPSNETLAAVADHLARNVGVIGAEVVAAAPRYREIAVEALLVARAGSDLAAAGSAARDAIDAWLDPLRWPFGGAVHWDELSRLLLAQVPALTAVSRLALRIDGRRLARCTDAVLGTGELTWPGSHQIEVVAS